MIIVNPIKWIFNLVKTIYKDLFEDVKFIGVVVKKSKNNEPIINEDKWQEYKTEMKKMLFSKEAFKKTWYWILAILFALAMGMLLSAKYYQNQCNNLIVENMEKWNSNKFLTDGLQEGGIGSVPQFPFMSEFPNSNTNSSSQPNDDGGG